MSRVATTLLWLLVTVAVWSVSADQAREDFRAELLSIRSSDQGCPGRVILFEDATFSRCYYGDD